MRNTGRTAIVLAAALIATSRLGAQLVTDEATRVQVLKAAFPRAIVSTSRAKPLDWKPGAWPDHELIDALAGEREYEVIGTPDKFEEGWATALFLTGLDGDPLPDRRIRFRVYEVKTGDASRRYVALAHYQFTEINHPFCCEWFARLFVLSLQDGTWAVQQTDDSLIYRAKTVRSFRLVDLGDGDEKVLVEAENTGAGYRRWITMSFFDLAERRLAKVAEMETLSTNDNVHTQFSRELNLEKTRRAAGKALYFETAEYGTDDQQFPAPRIQEDVVTLLGK